PDPEPRRRQGSEAGKRQSRVGRSHRGSGESLRREGVRGERGAWWFRREKARNEKDDGCAAKRHGNPAPAAAGWPATPAIIRRPEKQNFPATRRRKAGSCRAALDLRRPKRGSNK